MFDKRIKKIILKTLLSVTLLIPAFVSANYFTLPVDVNPAMDITAWFDHDNTVAKIRFDGQTDFSYDDHNGTDFYAATATPVLAPRDGEVKDVYWNNDGGWTIHVYHDDIGLSTVYAHVATTTIATTTDNILRYDQIAYVDSTGAAATGPHLHFGVVDDEELTGNRIDPFGWSGTSTDPWPYNQGYLWTTEPPSLCDEDGNITRTFFPSLDAVLYSGWSNSWSTTRNGYNVNANSAVASEGDFRLSDWYNGLTLYRFHSEFDTSSIGGEDIVSASLYINFNSVTSGNLSSHNGWVVTPSDYTGGTADAKWDAYTSVIAIPFSNETALAGPNGYTEFTLNNNGTSSINTSGTTKLGIVSYWDQVNADPNQAYGGYKNDYGTVLFSEQIGTAFDPKLVVKHQGNCI